MGPSIYKPTCVTFAACSLQSPSCFHLTAPYMFIFRVSYTVGGNTKYVNFQLTVCVQLMFGACVTRVYRNHRRVV